MMLNELLDIDDLNAYLEKELVIDSSRDSKYIPIDFLIGIIDTNGNIKFAYQKYSYYYKSEVLADAFTNEDYPLLKERIWLSSKGFTFNNQSYFGFLLKRVIPDAVVVLPLRLISENNLTKLKKKIEEYIKAKKVEDKEQKRILKEKLQ